MIAGLTKAIIDTFTDPRLGKNLTKGALKAVGPLRDVPVLGKMIPLTASSPLDLFDYNAYQKATREVADSNSYLLGRSYDIPSASYTAPNPKVGKLRKNAMLGVGGLAAANFLGVDPYGATSTANSLGAFAAHSFVGSTLYGAGGKSKLLGTAYLGLLGVNTLRSGNQTGPM